MQQQNDFPMSLDSIGLTQIKVIGIGGGGCNAVSRMFRERVQGVDPRVVSSPAPKVPPCRDRGFSRRTE